MLKFVREARDFIGETAFLWDDLVEAKDWRLWAIAAVCYAAVCFWIWLALWLVFAYLNIDLGIYIL